MIILVGKVTISANLRTTHFPTISEQGPLTSYEGWSKSSASYLVTFLVVNGSVLKIGMDIHWAFTYKQEKLYIDKFTTFLYVTSEVKKVQNTLDADNDIIRNTHKMEKF